MNKLYGKITAITSSGNISLVDAEVSGYPMSAIMIGTSENTGYLKEGREIILLFKESEVSVGKDIRGMISLRNQLPVVVEEVQKGTVFSKICMRLADTSIVSLITTRSAEKLGLKKGDEVTAFIKSNEVILMDPAHE